MIPDWVVNALLGVEVLGLGLVVWVWVQSFFNWSTVHDPELRAFAFRRMVRETVLVLVQMSAVVAYALVVFTAAPRPPLVALIITVCLIVTTVGVAVLSLHDFAEMRDFLDEEG